MFASLRLQLSVVFFLAAGLVEAQELSPEGVVRADAHRFLVEEFISNREVKISGKQTGTADHRILQELVVVQPKREFDTHALIELPDGAQRVAGMFRHLTLRGSGLLRIDSIKLLPFAATSHLHQSKSEDAFYRVQMASMPIPRADLGKISLELHCSGDGTTTVDTVEFHSQGKLSMKFDDIPFRNLGAERPRQKVSVYVDATCKLEIGGSTALEPQRWFRYYALPGRVPAGLERWANDRGFYPGRQIMKLHPALVKGYTKNQPRLVQDPQRPGHADLSFFESYDSSMGINNAIEPYRDVPFATCFDEWPAFMSRHPGGRGTPKVEHFDAAAELASAYVADQIKSAGRTAKWWEVKNESTIKSEWDYHYSKDHDSWDLLADFHNRVATQVKQRSPEVQVGGPTSAWMQVQVNDFGLYRSQQKFMDRTAEHLDFYSHHFYEDFGTIGAYERRSTKYSNYLLGRFEAILDMLHAHMDGTDNTKPILITECGSLQPGRSPSDDWLRLRSFSAYLTKAMQRPDQIDMIVPFIFLNVPWSPTSGNAAFEPLDLDPDSPTQVPGEPIEGYRRRQVSRFFDLWRGFDGDRLSIDFHHDFLDLVGVYKGNKIMVAATNMGGDRLSLDLTELLALNDVRKTTQRRLYYHDGRVHYKELDVSGEILFPVDVEETTVLEFTLNKPLNPGCLERMRRAYAPETAVKLAETKTFTIPLQNHESADLAKLVIGVHRDGGISQPLAIKINGYPIEVEKTWLPEFRNLFAPVEVVVSPEWLRDTNQIEIAPVPGATLTSLQLVVSSLTHPDRKRIQRAVGN